MRPIELLEKRTGAMKIGEVAKVLGVSPQQIHKMVASGTIQQLEFLGQYALISEKLPSGKERSCLP
jgi:hypothetical protein